MTTVIGILLLISYIGMIVVLIKGVNPILTLLSMGIIWAYLGNVITKGPWLAFTDGVLQKVLGDTVTKYAPSMFIILFGAWFAQILVQQGIVSSIIRSVVELGGDRPKVVTVLIMIVTSLLFTSLYSIGPVIAVGVIVLPILLSMGVKPIIACVAYCASVGVASIANVTQYGVLRGIFPEAAKIPAQFGSPYVPFAYIAFGAGILINIACILFMLRGKSISRSWSAQITADAPEEKKKTPWYSYFAPAIPVVLIIAFGINVYVAFIIGGLYAVLVTKAKGVKTFRIMSKTFADGMTDAAPMVMYMLGTYVFISATAMVAPIFTSTLGPIFPKTALALAIFAAVAAPLVLYRGVLAPGGAGAALFAALIVANVLPIQFVWLIGYIMSAVHYVMDPTGSLEVWTTSYTKVQPLEYIKKVVPIGWLFGIASVVICYFMLGR